MTVLLDIESRARIDLKVVGGRNYWEHPSTELLCLSWHDTATDARGTWHPGDASPYWRFTAPLAAHNMSGFDRFGLVRYGFLTHYDVDYLDTSELARTAGFPGALDDLGCAYGIPKDKVASKFTTALSSARRPKSISAADWRTLSPAEKKLRGDLPELTDETRARVDRYCESDVAIMSRAWDDLAPWDELEPDVVRLDRIINDRGVELDVDLCRALLREDARHADEVVSQVSRETGISDADIRKAAGSNPLFCAITGLPNAQKATVAACAHPLATVRRVLASIARGKLDAGLARVSPDGRLRDNHRYYGGHTGRWSGKGMQLQNLPRPSKRFEKQWAANGWDDGKHDDQISDYLDDLAEGIVSGRRQAQRDEINLLVRGSITAAPGHTLVVSDFSGIEARALAWAAGDRAALDVFTSGRDPYRVAAMAIFGLPYEQCGGDYRQAGKTAELACGYGQGAKKFGETAAKMGANLAAMGVDPKRVVDAWRRLHAPVVQFWDRCERAFRSAIGGHTTRVGAFEFRPYGSDVHIVLPSGRPLVYRIARLKADGRRQSIVYEGGRTGEEYTYGGKIVENLIQAACRDLLAEAMVKVEAAGLPIVLHVHDEIVVEVPREDAADAKVALEAWMCDAPEWADGLPLTAHGFICRRYRK